MAYSLEPLVPILKQITQRFIVLLRSYGKIYQQNKLNTRVETRTPLYTASASQLLFKIQINYTIVNDKFEKFDQNTCLTGR